MTALSISALGALKPASHAAEPAESRSQPLSILLLQCASGTGAMCALATLIYGIALSIFAWIAVGAIFIIVSLSSFYLIYQNSNLKSIEEDTSEIQKLNISIGQKDEQINQLTTQIRAAIDQLSVKEKESAQLLADQNSKEKRFNEQLQQAAQTLAKVQIDAGGELDRARKALSEQTAAHLLQSEKDQKMITQLNQTVTKMKLQNAALRAILTNLEQVITTYRQQTAEYARLNSQLQGQIQQLKEISHSGIVNVDAVNTHAANIEAAIADQKLIAKKTAEAAAEISALLKTINRRLPQQPNSSGG